MRGGFSLLEVMVATVVSGIIITAAVATFVFMAGSSLRLEQYSDMEGQSRQLLQQFSQDARQASNATWTDQRTLNLTVGPDTITYAYSPAAGTFTRTRSGQAVTMVSGITSFDFRAFQITGTELPLANSPAAAGPVTKMIQISLSLAQGNAAAGSTSSQLISARCVLRNKKIN
ncbi:MAG: prepilin-type N-terminal cleavage/methylation domain-containing protein [Verrucomicrobiota bacterium]